MSTPTAEHAPLQINVFIYLRVIRCTCCAVNAAIWVTTSGCVKSHCYMFENQLFLQSPNVHCITYITRRRSGFRHWATIRRVAGSIPDRVVRVYHSHNPSCLTMALGSNQPLTEMSTRVISWAVKAVSLYGWKACYLRASCADSLEILGSSTSRTPQGLFNPV